MIHGPRHLRSAWNRTAKAAVLIGLWLIGGMVPASSGSQVVAATKVHGGHRCACGMDCGPVCCCKHKPADEPAPERPEAPAKVAAKAGPCVASAPCGGALPPGVSAVALAGESADRAGTVTFLPASNSRLLVPPASDRVQARFGSPPDEPPERLADA